MAQSQPTTQQQLTIDGQHNTSSSSSSSTNNNNNNSMWDQHQLSQRDNLKVTDHPRIQFTGNNPRPTSISMLKPHHNSKNSRQEESSTLEQHQSFVSPSYAWQQHSMKLAQHIYQRGLLEGIGSDIVVKIPAWQGEYHLHRLILDQNPYFQTLFQGGFLESSSSEIVLHFEQHPYITDDSFMFVLSRLYGNVCDPDINLDNIQRLLATCSFFQLDSMCELCVEFILQTLSEHTVIDYLLFADGHLVFGSDRICDAVFTFLCREAYAMDLERLAGIPAAWLKKILSADSLWVTSEYHRYRFIQDIIQQRYKLWYQQNPSSIDNQQSHQQSSPRMDQTDYSSDEDDITTGLKYDQLPNKNYPKDSRYGNITPFSSPSSSSNTQSNMMESGPSSTEEKKKSNFSTTSYDDDGLDDKELDDILAAADDIISNSIHYMHMTFEQLEVIRQDINPFSGKPLVPDSIIKNALWNQIQMRSKIVIAAEEEKELGLTITTATTTTTTTGGISRGGREQHDPLEAYPIPTNDITAYTGESTLPCTNLTANRNPHHRTHQSLSLPLSLPSQQQHFKSPPSGHHSLTSTTSESPGSSPQYAQYPPFRFSVEFKDVSSLRRNVRVYSKTVFYAGSNWNMYIQKTRSQRKGILQLGVYLHRQSIHCDNNQQQDQQDQQSKHQNRHHHHHHHHHHHDSSNTDQSSFSMYSDKRLVTKTWFKIFCPSRSPKHTLTLFQSSPDDFSVLQSWGWRSTVLCADEVGNNHFTKLAPTGSQQASTHLHFSPAATTTSHSPGDSTFNVASGSFSSSSSPQLNIAMGNISLTSTLYSQSSSPEAIDNNSATRTHQSTPFDTAKQHVLPSSGLTLRFSVVMGHI
ncbi:hypothetical protein BC941DRAFT_408695 [Chlamydoabsidia padenii]|nr:hypothetical protein BC941DRAFT_408695 [Chlamydoabsidia padenii]